ncbi:MAG: aldehyde dehydrogenase family protein, partial [Gaiella sp.]
MATVDTATSAPALLERLGVDAAATTAGDLVVRTPITGEEIARVARTDAAATDAAIGAACDAFASWREVPAPHRGELVRLLGEELRREKETLGALVTLEVGKIVQEGLGEVQEMIDICDFAVGLSRQLYGRSIASERPGHRLTETWHPLGPVGVVSAFNFPVAVWSWNAALALVCGDPVVWKPSEKTPLTAVACHNVVRQVLAESRDLGVPDAVCNLAVGDRHAVGEPL